MQVLSNNATLLDVYMFQYALRSTRNEQYAYIRATKIKNVSCVT